MNLRPAQQVPIILVAAVVSLSLTIASGAAAEHDPVEDISNLIIDVAPPGLLAEADLIKDAFVSENDNDISLKFEGGEVALPIDPLEPIVISSVGYNDHSLEISLPEEVDVTAPKVADSGMLVYDANDHSALEGVSVAVQIDEDGGGVRVHTIIPNTAAPRSYTYDFGMPTDATTEHSDDGSIYFTTSEGEWLGGVAAPWARDANGKSLATHYELDSNMNLIQHVTFNEKTSFPVVADPYLGKNLFKSVTVNTWNGDKRINLQKSAWGNFNNLTSTSGVMRLNGWNEAVSRAEKAKGGYKGMMSKGTLRQQYNCHVAATTLLNWATGEWNLERARSTRPGGMDGWLTTSLVKSRCNW